MVSKIKNRLLYENMEKETIGCSICGSHDYTKILDRNNYEMGIDMVMCRHCSFLFTNPRPTQAAIGEFYKKGYRGSDSNSLKTPKEYDELSSVYRRAQWLFGLVVPEFRRRHIERPRILDIGCGSGIVLHIFRKCMPSCELYGVEPSPTFSKHARERNSATVFTEDMDSFVQGQKNLTGSFHLIVLLHVLEHLYDPVEKLRQLGEFLAPGGLLLVQVPTPFSAECPKVSRMFHIAHVNQFHPRTLEYTLRRAGLGDLRECPSSPRVITTLGRKTGGPMPKEEIPPIDEKEFLSLSGTIQEKISNEYRLKIPAQRSLKDRAADVILRNLSRFQNAGKLRRMIHGHIIWIIGPKPSPAELENIPPSARIFTCNRAVRLFADGVIQRDIDLYLCVKNLLKAKKVKEISSKLVRIRTRLLVTDDIGYIRNKKEWRNIYDSLIYDNGVDDYYLKRIVDAADLESVRGKTDQVVSAELRLLQYALYFGAAEIGLAGVDFGDKGALWGENHPEWPFTDSDEEFMRLVSEKYRNVYALSNESPLTNYLPYKNMNESPDGAKTLQETPSA